MVGHSTTEAAIANVFGHKTEQLGDTWSKRDATSCNLSANSIVDTTSISHATIHLQNKKQHCSVQLSPSVSLVDTHTQTQAVIHVHSDPDRPTEGLMCFSLRFKAESQKAFQHAFGEFSIRL